MNQANKYRKLFESRKQPQQEQVEEISSTAEPVREEAIPFPLLEEDLTDLEPVPAKPILDADLLDDHFFDAPIEISPSTTAATPSTETSAPLDVTEMPALSPETSEPSDVSATSVPARASRKQPKPKKRGRPATGKRSDENWIGRTYYVQRETDLDVEDELLRLKRRGVEIDKSELVDFLLDAWVQWHKGKNIDLQLDAFSPRRKSQKLQ